ncbi:MAG: NifB/NifX family molybdenum-iron cluster-binding protein [Candidatus Pacebacteria bacterium]|nr:NifB/NifX family molybdenum-iron cluster-binding protein [Candidatus Paceibacterota bacterium]
MKIVIPTNSEKGLDDTTAEHFGRCNTYTFLDEKGNVIEVIANTSEHMGGTGLPPELMKKHGADVLLCKGLGMKALDLCKELGIDIYVCQAQSVKEIFEMWKNDKIKKASSDDTCPEHK